MSEMFTCGDHAALVSYLYDDCDPQQRRSISAHVAVCSACAEEIAGLSATREQLALWSPPDAQLGFKIVSEDQKANGARSNLLRPAAWWRQPMPAWAQAAAAVLIFGTGMTLGALRNATVRDTARSATPAAAIAASGAAPVTTADLAALEQRLRGEIAQTRATGAVASNGPVSASDAQVLARVKQMIDDSEERQRREIALRTAEVTRDFDAQRSDDMVRIERTLGQMDGTTGAEVAQQRQVLNYLMRVSQRGQ
jgi:anti-sigma factor ChrR (cupin superfamily)